MQHDKRIEVIVESTSADATAWMNVLTRRVDPTGKSLLGWDVGHIICDEEDSLLTPGFKKTFGSLLYGLLRNGTLENLERFCAELIELKKAAVKQPRRHAWAWVAVLHFKEEMGFYPDPDGGKLRMFIQQHPDRYLDQPRSENPQAWTPLWKESGIRDFLEWVKGNPPKPL